MSNAFYLEPDKWAPICYLEGEDAIHARALRLHPGDHILLLDGLGKSADAIALKVTKKQLEVEIRDETVTPPPLSRPLMAIAVSKAARRGFFMEKAVELGAWGIWLWTAERSQGHVSKALLASCHARLIAGLKQSGNPWLPQLRGFASLRDVCSATAGVEQKIVPWENEKCEYIIQPSQLGRPGETIYVIGPEGGFSATELEQLDTAGFISVSLGKRVLRCETAATLCLGLHSWSAQVHLCASAQ